MRKPQHLDIIYSAGSPSATGPFDIIINCDGELRSYPILFLDEDDDENFTLLRKRISGSKAPEHVMPLGKMKRVWKKEI